MWRLCVRERRHRRIRVGGKTHACMRRQPCQQGCRAHRPEPSTTSVRLHAAAARPCLHPSTSHACTPPPFPVPCPLGSVEFGLVSTNPLPHIFRPSGLPSCGQLAPPSPPVDGYSRLVLFNWAQSPPLPHASWPPHAPALPPASPSPTSRPPPHLDAARQRELDGGLVGGAGAQRVAASPRHQRHRRAAARQHEQAHAALPDALLADAVVGQRPAQGGGWVASMVG